MNQNKNKLLVVILTWNDYNNTKECIKCAFNISNSEIYFLIVDNNSTDESFKKLINEFRINKIENISYSSMKERYMYIENKENLGCGFGHNTGYEFAIKNNFEYVARIDNDMKFKKNFFDENIKVMDHDKNIISLSPKIMYSENHNRIWWMGCKIGNNLKFDGHMRDYSHGIIDSNHFSGLKKTDAIAGCASIMRTENLKTSGLSDKDFFYGPEDIELSYRLRKNKGYLAVNLDSKIFHKGTQSFRGLNKRKIYFEVKYRLLLIKKIGTFMDQFIGFSFHIIKFFAYCLLCFYPKHRKKLTPVGKALVDFFIFQRLGDYDRKFNNR